MFDNIDNNNNNKKHLNQMDQYASEQFSWTDYGQGQRDYSGWLIMLTIQGFNVDFFFFYNILNHSYLLWFKPHPV